MDVNRFVLPNAIHAVCRLRLYRRIPPPSIMDNVIGLGNRQSDTGYKRRKDYHIETGTLSEAIQHSISGSPRLLSTQAAGVYSRAPFRTAVHDVRLDAKLRCNDSSQNLLHRDSISKNNYF